MGCEVLGNSSCRGYLLISLVLTRASAFIALAFLVVVNLSMKTRFPPRPQDTEPKALDIKGILLDGPYLLCTIAYVKRLPFGTISDVKQGNVGFLGSFLSVYVVFADF